MTKMSYGDLESFLVTWLAKRLHVDADSIEAGAQFGRHGLDSLHATALLTELGGRLGRKLSPTLVFEYPTISALSRYLLEGPPRAALRKARSRPEDEPIAIVGMSCRFPKAPNLISYWRL